MHDVLPAPLRRSLSKFGHDLAVARRKRRLTVSKFGHDLAVARRKRRLTVSMMAERTGLAKSTYARLEAGDPAVAMGAYAMALFVLGFGAVFGEVADARRDEAGLLLDEERLPKRVRSRTTPTPI